MSYKRKFFLMKLFENYEHAWFSSTYVLYLLSSGLTLNQTAMVNTVFMTVNFLTDPFTGWLGDKIGHIKVYLMGMLVIGTGMFLYGFPKGFEWFIMCEAISALGSSLMSQALESWLVNNYGNVEAAKTKAWTKGRISILTLFPRILGGLIGSAFGLNIPFLISGITVFIGFGVGLYIFSREKEILPPSHESIKANAPQEKPVSLREAVGNEMKSVWQIAILLFLLAMSYQPLNMYWTPLLQAESGQAWWLGFYSVAIGVTVGWGPVIASKYFAYELSSIAKVVALMALCIFISAISPSLLVLCIVFLGHEVARGAIDHLVDTYSNQRFSDTYRATSNSILSSWSKAGSATGLFLLSGLTFVEIEHIPYLWIASSVVMLIASAVCLIRARR
jgi:MFS family permease